METTVRTPEQEFLDAVMILTAETEKTLSNVREIRRSVFGPPIGRCENESAIMIKDMSGNPTQDFPCPKEGVVTNLYTGQTLCLACHKGVVNHE